MMRLRAALLHRLASEKVLPVESLARELGESIESLLEHMEALRTRGLEVEVLSGGRARLRTPLEVLDRNAIIARLGADSRRILEALDLLFETGSTNQYLLDLARDAEEEGAPSSPLSGAASCSPFSGRSSSPRRSCWG